jgi:hypothetical protein
MSGNIFMQPTLRDKIRVESIRTTENTMNQDVHDFLDLNGAKDIISISASPCNEIEILLVITYSILY